jgi:regulation of enolase protein 1 (concanavalin A-like superfamily)
MFKNFQWHCEPPKWDITDNQLVVETAYQSDFWRKTFYGFLRDNGHFFYKETEGDFTMKVTIFGDFETLYDQLGLMVRLDESHWVKTGIEFTDGEIHLSSVFTNEYSDWSVVKYPYYNGELTIRITRHEEAIRIQFLNQDGKWQMLRLGYLPGTKKCKVGIMCCSPERSGFKAGFKNFEITEPIDRKLHED